MRLALKGYQLFVLGTHVYPRSHALGRKSTFLIDPLSSLVPQKPQFRQRPTLLLRLGTLCETRR